MIASGRRMHQIAVALTGDTSAAADLVQDVLERMYVAWPRIDDPVAYARRALVNASANRWRRRHRRPEVELTDAHDVLVRDHADAFDDRDMVLAVIKTLPTKQRAVIALRYLEDLSEADIAVALSCSVGTVKSHTARALATLRARLEEMQVPARSDR